MQGFENGAAGWTTSGFWRVQERPETVRVSPAVNPLLVTLPDAGALPAAAEGEDAAWFGEVATGTYCGADFATIRQSPKNGCRSTAPRRGAITSPAFSLAGMPSARLEFSAWWEIEALDAEGSDLMRVEVSADDGATWSVARRLNPVDPPWGGGHQQYSNSGARSSGAWETHRVDLSAALGSSAVRVRFVFDTVGTRRNGFRGLLVDRVTVVGADGAPIVTDDTAGFGEPPAPSLSVTSPTATPNSDGTWQVTFGVELSAPSPLAVSVNYAVEDARPVSVATGQITLPPGSVRHTETLTIPAASVPPFTVTLSDPVNAMLGGSGASSTGGDQLVLGVRQQGGGPEIGQTFVATHVSGEVLYRVPAGRYVRLAAGTSRTLPMRSVLDTRKGRVRITLESEQDGALQRGDFWDGIFGVFQARRGRPVAELRLGGGDFGPCRGSRSRARGAQTRKIRSLWGNSRGRFRTKGRFASATVRGTEWLTEDLCLATRIRVTEGSVVVRDFRRRRSTVVEAGDSITVGRLRAGRYRRRTGLNPPRISSR